MTVDPGRIGLAVVATGNHFVFDMVAGVVASVLGYGLGVMAARVRIKRPTAPKLAAMVGTVFMAGYWWYEAFAGPGIAVDAPQLV